MNLFRGPVWVGAKRPGRPWRIRTYESWYDSMGERHHRVTVKDTRRRATFRDRRDRPAGLSGRQWVKLRKARRRAEKAASR